MQAFIDAVNAQEEVVIEDVASDAFADQVIDTWFGTYLTDAEIGDTIQRGETVEVIIHVTPENGDGSVPNGQHVTWTMVLEQEGDNWVITDLGQG